MKFKKNESDKVNLKKYFTDEILKVGKQNKHRNFLIIVKNGKVVKFEEKLFIFFSIPKVLLWGSFYNKHFTGNLIKLYFRYKPSQRLIQLKYILSTKDNSIQSTNIIMDTLSDIGIKLNVKFIEALVVNPKISKKRMNRIGWHLTKSTFYGKYYRKNIK